MWVLNKWDAGWVGRSSFASKSFYSAFRVVLRVFQCFKYTYVACLKVFYWFVVALYGLFVFMVYWI